MPTDLRNLPPDVLDRIGDTRGLDTVQRGKLIEARQAHKVEIRSTDNGLPIVDGYATVYDYGYDIAGGPDNGGWTEIIARGACDKSVSERADVRLLFDHEGIPLARTASGTLVLASDDTGLRFSTPDGIDVAGNPFAAAVGSALIRGDLDQCSYAFRALRQSWNADFTERTITECQLFDVSVVTYPANPATVAQVRAGGPAAYAPDGCPECGCTDMVDGCCPDCGYVDSGPMAGAPVTPIGRGMSLAFAKAVRSRI